MSISLSPEIEAKLRARAQSRGYEVNEFANEIISSALNFEADEPESLAESLEEGLRAIREGRVRPFSEFIREHRERWPDPKE